jgi:arylsulfatase A-like enzyme
MNERRPSRLSAALVGAGLAGLLCAAPVLWAQLKNPWFMDRPGLWTLLAVLPAGLLGAVMGLALARWLGRLPLVAALACWLLGWAASPLVGQLWPRPQRVDSLRLLVVGVDGATFDLMDPMGGSLPTFEALMERGVRADLQAAEPMFSPLLWTTMSTGKTPEQHGVHGFDVNAGACRSARFWEIMEDAGLDTGIYKWLVTYPPQELATFQVPAWLAPAPDTWPADLSFIKEIELSRRLKRKQVRATRGNAALALEGLSRGFRLGTLFAAARFSLAEKLLGPDPERAHQQGQLIRVMMDRDLFVHLLHQHDPAVATFTDYATDAIGHRFWKYHQPELFSGVEPGAVDRWGDSLPHAYRQADAVLAELLALLPPDARVVVLSDHGFQALQGGEDSGMFFAPRTERLRALIEQRGIAVEVAKLGHKVVVTSTGGEGGDDVRLSLERIETVLAGLVQDSTGEPFYRWERVADDPRSLGLTLRDERVTPQRIQEDSVGGEPLSEFVRLTEAYSGVHERDGIFLAAGPGIAQGVTLDPMSHLDVTPTLLELVGLPPAQDMVGAAPQAMFTQPPALPEAPPSYDALVTERRLLGASDTGSNEEALRALGYID